MCAAAKDVNSLYNHLYQCTAGIEGTQMRQHEYWSEKMRTGIIEA